MNYSLKCNTIPFKSLDDFLVKTKETLHSHPAYCASDYRMAYSSLVDEEEANVFIYAYEYDTNTYWCLYKQAKDNITTRIGQKKKIELGTLNLK